MEVEVETILNELPWQVMVGGRGWLGAVGCTKAT